MAPKGNVSTRLNPLRLNTINHLRVRRPNQNEQNPCVTVMSTMLNCWASQGYGAEGCAALEGQLRKCMDAPVRFPTPNTFQIKRALLIIPLPLCRNPRRRRRTPSTTT